MAILPPCSCEPSFVRPCEPAGFPSLRDSRRGNPSLPSLNDLARLPRRSADALLLATTTIPFRPFVARLPPCSSQRLQVFRHCEPAGVAIPPSRHCEPAGEAIFPFRHCEPSFVRPCEPSFVRHCEPAGEAISPLRVIANHLSSVIASQ